MTQVEIAVMDGGKCNLQVRGVRPYFSDKFDITKYPKYKYLSDSNTRNAFGMEPSRRNKVGISVPTGNEFIYCVPRPEWITASRSAG